ncbi:hypothetical protein GCM10023187_36780 [Nibrella viscosa]|uniref:Uncharacterized protein n=1 Tax=Nibrella viscosa TaxID=1084524 RepID=A0ABP8KNS6_9BACT
MNIKFEYMYRDAGNYKLYNTCVLTNRFHKPVDELETRIRKSLIDEEYFNPVKCKIPKLEFPDNDDDLDHNWHEFLSISSTDEAPDLQLDILEFVQLSTVAHCKAFP